MAKSDRLYKDSPKLERGEDGDVGVKKPSEADGEDMGTSGKEGEMPVAVHHSAERHELHHRHVHEALALHRRHETEHATHKGDKKPLHKKHEAEHKELHDRHH